MEVLLHDVLYAPDLFANLVSGAVLEKRGFYFNTGP